MYKLGLKLWSTNKHYIKEAVRLYEKNMYDYIELFVVPASFREHITLWKNINVPYVIHAAHSAVGLNLSKKEYFKKNVLLANEAKRFADELKSNIIIFHPGVDGDIEETIVQLKSIKDTRIVIENKPYYAIYDNLICVGYSPKQIKDIIEKVEVGFCCDIGHAIYAANAQKVDPFEYLNEFVTFNPRIYHLSDGDFYGVYDQHENIGKGSFRLKEILKILPKDGLISLETKKTFSDNLSDFENDVFALRNIFMD